MWPVEDAILVLSISSFQISPLNLHRQTWVCLSVCLFISPAFILFSVTWKFIPGRLSVLACKFLQPVSDRILGLLHSYIPDLDSLLLLNSFVISSMHSMSPV